MRFVDRFVVRGKRQELEIYEVLWDVTDLTVAPGPLEEPERGDLRLQLRYQGIRIDLGPGRRSASLGRGRDNDIVIQDNQSSRFHAKVEFRKSRFYLVDQSLNGTYVRINGDDEVCLRHEELPLKGEGLISLGRQVDAEPGLQIAFFVGSPPPA
jgi:adenylate cyclase